MLSTDDIKKLTDYQVLVFKDVFLTKEEFSQKFSKLQASVDGIARDNQIKNQELPVINRRVKELESWADKAAPKLDIKFEH